MVSELQYRLAASNFRIAAADFGFDFIEKPSLDEGINAFGYLTNYGSENGTVICLTTAPDFKVDHRVFEWCQNNGYHCAFLNAEPLCKAYSRAYFREMLRDWGRYHEANR